jgi:nucleotide-binding universal stress UspA family protein
MTYTKILAAIDRSPLGEQVFEQALAIAKQDQAALLLFNVVPIEPEISPYVPLYQDDFIGFSSLAQENLKRETEDVRLWMQSLSQKAIAAGITPEWDIKVGEPGRWIRESSQSWNADLIVIGRRGLKGMAEMFLGSVSNYIVHHVHCSVLIIQGGEGEETV